jgi:hypothetical protein
MRSSVMSFSAKVQARLEELAQTGESIKATKWTSGGGGGRVISIPETYVDEEQARQWTMNALTILKSALGEDNDNYQQVKENLPMCALYRNFGFMVAAVKAALDDLKGGYFFEAKTLLEAEVFNDLLEQAEELHQAGYKDAAAVLGGAVLERHMRSMCVGRGIGLLKPNGKHKMINDMNDELAKAGAYNALKKKQVVAWADLRNNAAHGNTGAYTADDVGRFLRDVSDFCASNS